jgi:serine/threonine-protein kinase
VGRFEIVRELGRGGFGVVYEALDRELGRSVAFKLLRASVQPSAREDRLLREAETAARLSHPNIVTLFDVGRCEYGPYLVLELLHGETLAQRLSPGTPGLAEAIRVTVEVARGLSHAHARGIVHRDLSPSNLFLCDDGHVKLLDLGMAQAFGRRKLDGGTPAFMAPEQWRGAPEDERTDVFALGVLLYRMLAGELPFADDEGRSVTSSRPAPMLHVPEAPALPGVVERMLAKDPVDRYRDASEVVSALTPILRAAEGAGSSGELSPPRPVRRNPWRRAVLAAAVLAAAAGAWLARDRMRGPGPLPPASTVPAVAVLPFKDLSARGDQAHFADGLAEEILNALVQIEGLRVAGRTSSFHFRDKDVPLSEIGSTLKVDAVLDGSVRQAGNRLRITAQLVGVRDGYQLWSQIFDREVSDVFAVQDEISHAVARALRVKLAPGNLEATAERRTAVPEAYEQYLVGRRFYHLRATRDGFERAVAAFERSVAADPGYAPSWAGLAVSLAGMADRSENAAQVAEYKQRAIEAADRAVSAGPEIPDAYWARGFVRSGIQRDWAGSRADFERSLALNPRQPEALRRYGTWYLGATGRVPEGVAALRKATELDPLYMYAWSDLALLQLKHGDTEAAGLAIAKALEISPENVLALRHLVVKQLLEGRPQAALETAQRIGEEPWRLFGTALALQDLGRKAESLAALDALSGKEGHNYAFQIAEVHAYRGENDEAFAWLDRAIEQRDSGLPLDLKGDPLFRKIRGDPRFDGVLARVGLPVD